MKQILCVSVAIFLVACAGNPPAWWNPGNRYGQAETTQSTQTSSAPARKVIVPQEESIEPLPDSSYEEEAIAPLPEEEDTPAIIPLEEPALDTTLPAPSVLE